MRNSKDILINLLTENGITIPQQNNIIMEKFL